MAGLRSNSGAPGTRERHSLLHRRPTQAVACLSAGPNRCVRRRDCRYHLGGHHESCRRDQVRCLHVPLSEQSSTTAAMRLRLLPTRTCTCCQPVLPPAANPCLCLQPARACTTRSPSSHEVKTEVKTTCMALHDRTRVQAAPIGQAPNDTAAASVMGVVRSLLREEGARGLLRGTGPRMLKIGFGQGIIFGAYDAVKAAL